MKVESVEIYESEDAVDVFDIGVKDNHNYFIYPPIGDSAVLAHNCHKAAATEFSKVVSGFKTRYKFGVTGTVERKDGKHWVIKKVLGPIVAKSEVEALTPIVYVHPTPVEGKVFPQNRISWVRMNQYLARHSQRNAHIVKQVIRDIKNGHNILIPVLYKSHMFELQGAINKAYGKKVCEIFEGGGGKKNKEIRKETLTAIKANNIKCCVGIRSLLQLGLNVPSWSAVYEIMPISNEPNLKQETSRIRTPKKGKNTPIIRLYVDRHQPQSASCARTTVKHLQKFGYEFCDTPEQRRELKETLTYGTGRRRATMTDDLKPFRTLLGDDITPKKKKLSRRL